MSILRKLQSLSCQVYIITVDVLIILTILYETIKDKINIWHHALFFEVVRTLPTITKCYKTSLTGNCSYPENSDLLEGDEGQEL